MEDSEIVERARQGDRSAFERLVSRHRRELSAHCYRMLGSPQDAEDALQEALLGAWRGLAGFDGRSLLRTWLYAIATHACLRFVAQRPRRLLTRDHVPARRQTADLGEVIPGPVFLEPWPDEPAGDEPGPAARYLRRESVELAFLAALQHLPGTQRAALILREVLEYSAEEVAEMLGTTVASVNSALQRARKAVEERVPQASQQDELTALGLEGRRELVAAFVSAWERSDVDRLSRLLTEDARFSMPPLPAWFDGRPDVLRFFAERVLATPWRLVPVAANGQLGFACYQRSDGPFRLGAINLLTIRGGAVAEITGFLDPAVHRRFGLPEIFPGDR